MNYEDVKAKAAYWAKLVTAIRAGDESAWDELFEDSFSYVFATAKNSLRYGPSVDDEAQDICQVVYMNVFENLGKLKDPLAFMKWLKMVTRSSVSSYLQKKHRFANQAEARGETVKIVELHDEFVDDRVAADDVTLNVETESQAASIQYYLQMLPEAQRLTLSLFYMDQLSLNEIAARTSSSTGTVKSRLYYGKKKLQELLEAHERKIGMKLFGAAPLPLLLLLADLRNWLMPFPAARASVVWNALVEASVVPATAAAGAAALSGTSGSAGTAAASFGGTSATAGGVGASAAASVGKAAVVASAAKTAGMALAWKVLLAVVGAAR